MTDDEAAILIVSIVLGSCYILGILFSSFHFSSDYEKPNWVRRDCFFSPIWPLVIILGAMLFPLGWLSIYIAYAVEDPVVDSCFGVKFTTWAQLPSFCMLKTAYRR
jgi:tryptophan-rich sensory protein